MKFTIHSRLKDEISKYTLKKVRRLGTCFSPFFFNCCFFLNNLHNFILILHVLLKPFLKGKNVGMHAKKMKIINKYPWISCLLSRVWSPDTNVEHKEMFKFKNNKKVYHWQSFETECQVFSYNNCIYMICRRLSYEAILAFLIYLACNMSLLFHWAFTLPFPS